MNILERVADGDHYGNIAKILVNNLSYQYSSELITHESANMFSTEQFIISTSTNIATNPNTKCTCNENPKASSYHMRHNGKIREKEQKLIEPDLPNTKNIHKHPSFTCTDNNFKIFSEFVTNSCNLCETFLGTENLDFKKKCSRNFIVNVIKLSCIVNLFKKYSFISLFLISFILLSTIKTVNANELTPQNNLSGAEETGVCQSVDIRNKPQNLSKLKGCKIVEGFVQILLMDNYQHEAFDNYSFPDLVEITDFLLLFRINGLKTLQKLFPNLAVIRGNSLFQNYALVIYEMVNLQEIALYSLTNITRGGVRIEKNPMLCFADTIDWTRIASSQAEHYIVNNKKGICLSCPGGGKKGITDEKHIVDNSLDCPISTGKDKKRLCWNLQKCQSICPLQCGSRACNKNGECCNESCIGSCSNDNTKNCTVCKDYSYLDSASRVCLGSCPNGTFVHMNRRCITEEKCRMIKKPLVFNNEQAAATAYIPFNGICTLECPVDHYETDQKGQRWCKRCEAGRCRKVCAGANIDSIQSAQKLRGCTHIDGSLEIQIRSQGGMNIVPELEQSLSAIEEIDGYLKVVRSYPLLSLNFLKRLKVITGKTTDNQKRSLVIMDNQHLQELWDEDQRVEVKSGIVFFYFNPKLCFYKIVNFINKNTNGVDEHTLSTFRATNGEKIACNVTLLNVTADVKSPDSVILRWVTLDIDDDRTLLGYVVYYIVAPFQNVSMFESRAACGGDGWHVVDVGSTGQANYYHLLAHLEPYTQYAFYVKTYTLSTEQNGAESPIQYFTTLPGKPELVQKLHADRQSNSEIMVYWEPPRKVNGNLTSYIIKCTLSEENNQLLDQRDYCAEPITPKDMSIPEIPETKPTVDSPKQCDCAHCPAVNPSRSFEENEAEQQINFEDHLHNYVYVKRSSPVSDVSLSRLKRESKLGNDSIIPLNQDVVFPHMPVEANSSKPNLDETRSIKNGQHYDYFYKEVNSSVKQFMLSDLKHYSFYTIEVKACREGPGPDNCSNEAFVNQRTSKISNADDIVTFNVMLEQRNNSLRAARIIWVAPERPNGIIISYTIKYKKVIQDSKPNIICITSKQFANISGSYLLTGLDQGNYSIQIMASSLAGDGNYTPAKYIFIQEDTSLYLPITLTIGILALIGFGIGCLYLWFRQKDQSMRANMKLIASVNPEYVSMTYQPDEWEVPREKIIQLQELGQGSFGMVYQGIVKNLTKPDEEMRCAIKTVNENATDRERINFLKEASVMKAFHTNHVVRLLGVVSSGQPTLVIMELMPNGDLKGYLRSHRPNSDIDNGSDILAQPPTLKRILQMAIEIADGMAYLAAKKFVHRDLAARNCMVADDLTVKIGDFGMTRDIYETDYYRKGTKGLLPVRWMSPESLKDGVFTSSSDVFSFGVVLWEMATLASQPYQGLSNDQVLRYVIDGGVMERPENCPDKLYDLMRQCWQHRPSARPSFLQIVQFLHPDSHSKFQKVSFFHSPEGQECLAQLTQIQKPDETQPLRLDTDDDHDHDLMDADDSYTLDRTSTHLIDGNQPTRIRPTDSLR